MNILDRFSKHLKNVLSRSIHLATELKNPEADLLHFLFALTTETGSVSAEILHRFKVDDKTLQQFFQLSAFTSTHVIIAALSDTEYPTTKDSDSS